MISATGSCTSGSACSRCECGSCRRVDPPTWRRGLTLVELLVSIVILSFGTVLIAQALVRIAQAQAIGERYDQAYLFLASKMAELELSVRTEGSLTDGEHGSFRVEAQAYQWRVSAQPFAEDVPEMQVVAMTVSWDYAGHAYQRQADTVFFMPPPPK